MSVDITQFIEGDDILVTYRATVVLDNGNRRARLAGSSTQYRLADAVKAEHVTPEVRADQLYIDVLRNLFVGRANGTVYGPLASKHAREYGPTELVLIRGLRAAEVRPVVPA